MGDIVLYVAGGAMAGVFSAGVLDVLHEVGLTRRLSAVHAVSAGAFNAAVLLSGQPSNALRWYTSVAPAGNVIRTRNPLRVIAGAAAVDLDAAERLIADERLLDVDALLVNQVPFYVKVMAADTKEVRYIDAKRPDALKLIRASATVLPFAKQATLVDGVAYVDGAIGELVGVERLKQLHPDAKLVLLLNSSTDERLSGALYWLAMRMHDKELSELLWQNIRRTRLELEAAARDPSVLIIAPPAEYAVTGATTDTALLLQGYLLGRQAAVEALPRLEKLFAEEKLSQPAAVAS